MRRIILVSGAISGIKTIDFPIRENPVREADMLRDSAQVGYLGKWGRVIGFFINYVI